MTRFASPETLETRIAPALVVVNPLADILLGAGQSGKTIELSQMFDDTIAGAGHTFVTFTLNLDSDPNQAGIQSSTFVLELYDDQAPLTVQNFLRYVQTPKGSAEFIDTFFHRVETDFVVQGGGFSSDNFGTHIPVFSEVHNEFDASRSNLRGTIAMAKTESSPNTATSEWFVNLSDNSSNLDFQNGGFTVFGRVSEGLDIFDKIAALPRANFGGALTNVPVQNFNSDPDNNPDTKPPTPGLDNLIRITDINVETPQVGSETGVTYAVTSSIGSLVGAKVNGSKLNLTYNGKSSGTSTVTVTATKGGETVTEEFLVTLKPNLIAAAGNDALHPIIVPGDHGKITIIIKNTGGGAFSGPIDLKLFLSQETDDDPKGLILDEATDLFAGQLLNKTVNIPAGGSVKLSTQLAGPTNLVSENGIFKVLAQVVPTGGSGTELFSDDNISLDGDRHGLTNQFGTVSLFGVSRTGVKLAYTDPLTDSLVKLSMKGAGGGVVELKDGKVNLTISGTTLGSEVKLSSGGLVSFDQIEAKSTLGKMNFGIASVTGDIAISGGIKALTFGDVGSASDDTRLSINSFPPTNTQKVSIKLGRATNFSVESLQAISTLSAVDWHDAGGADDYVSSPSISTLKITGKKSVAAGDFEANVTTYADAKLGNLSVAGVIRNATIKTRGDIGTVVAGGMNAANIFAGAIARPDDLSDFTDARTIQSFSIKKIEGASNQFVDSQVAASVISKIVVRGVQTTSGDDAFGFVADRVGSYSRDGIVKLSNLTEPAANDAVDNYELLIL